MVKLRGCPYVLAASTTIFITLVALSLWSLWATPIVLAGVYFALAAGMLFVLGCKKTVLVFVVCALGGAAVECVAIHTGGWQYTVDSFLRIPVWLIPGWGNMAIFAIAVYKFFSRMTAL